MRLWNMLKTYVINSRVWRQKEPSPTVLTGLTHHTHSRMQSLDCSMWRLWTAVFRPWPGSPLLRINLVAQASAQATILTPNFKRTSYRHETRHVRTPRLIPSTDPSLQSSWITEARHYLRLPEGASKREVNSRFFRVRCSFGTKSKAIMTSMACVRARKQNSKFWLTFWLLLWTCSGTLTEWFSFPKMINYYLRSPDETRKIKSNYVVQKQSW